METTNTQVGLKNAIEAISMLGRIQAEMNDLRHAEIAAQKKLNESSNNLSRWLGLQPGRNRVILHNGKAYNLEVTVNGAELIQLDAFTI